jgi:hypothetical protein
LAHEARTLDATTKVEVAIAQDLARPPTTLDGVDAFTATSLGSSLKDSRRLLADRNREVDRAEDAGRGSRVTFAILLAGLALTLSALAASARAEGVNLMDGAAGALLVVALVTAGSVLLV